LDIDEPEDIRLLLKEGIGTQAYRALSDTNILERLESLRPD